MSQFVLYPVARPTALALDRWLGPEAISYFKEHELRELIKMHMESPRSDIDTVEGRGSLNFLALDDLPVAEEGEIVDPKSVIRLEFEGRIPLFPAIKPSVDDEFLKAVNNTGKKWVIIVDQKDNPRIALDAASFTREALFRRETFSPFTHCHRPIIVGDPRTSLGMIIPQLKVQPESSEDDVIDEDIILYWSDKKQVITGSDILGRLLRGIVRDTPHPQQPG